MKNALRAVCQTTSMIILLAVYTLSAAQDTSYIVVNRPDPLLDPAAIKLIIRGERRNWEDGIPITVILPGNGAESHEHVATKFFGGNGDSMKRHWLRMVFSGRSRAPVYAGTDSEIYRMAREIPGALAVVSTPPPENYPIPVGTVP